MSIKDMNGLFAHFLKDIYYAEKALDKAMPKMVSKAADERLKRLLEEHHGETKEQITRLEDVFELVGVKAEGVRCEAIEGILAETEELMGECEDDDTRDAAITAAAQAVEHYEINRYGALASWANLLGHHDAAARLSQTLDEERRADDKLNVLSESKLNRKAA